MANKVLSIKIDEKDIERLKTYYMALCKAGFFLPGSMSLNAFYKHLLLDYLEDDICRVFSVYSRLGMTPRCINPEELNENGRAALSNTYNFDDEMFELYKKCAKQALSRNTDTMKESVEMLNEVVDANVVISNGTLYEMECFPSHEGNNRSTSFWEDKVFEILDLQEKEYKENCYKADIEMIEKATISEEDKQKLINEIVSYENKRKQNFIITQGRGVS